MIGSPLPVELQYLPPVELVLLPSVGYDSGVGSAIVESSAYLREVLGILLLLLGSTGYQTCSH